MKRIIIPHASRPAPSWITVEIVGEAAPTAVFGTIGDFPLRDKGTIPKCLDNNPLFLAAGPATGFFNGLHPKSNFLAVSKS